MTAQHLRTRGATRVAIIDIDAHQGNGTQEIFWDRSDVTYASVHVDPGAGWFPHLVGFADETGGGPGEGATRNAPLPPGTTDGEWLAALAPLVYDADNADAIVVSLGVDAAAGDPESPLNVTAAGFREAGAMIGGLGRPTVFVQEGGYDLARLGPLVLDVLTGFEEVNLRRR